MVLLIFKEFHELQDEEILSDKRLTPGGYPV